MGAMLVRHEPTSAAAVRRELAVDLDLHGVDPGSIDDVALVASELVGNAVRHTAIPAGSDLDVHWDIGTDDVLVSVADPSERMPVQRRPAPDAPNGRGLTIVAALCSEWGADLTPTGKRVWARVRTRCSRLDPRR